MNDAQTWTVIGGFLAIMVFAVGLVLRTVTTEIRAVRGEVNSVHSALGSEIRSVQTEVRALAEIMSTKIDTLDRDVQRLVEHWFGDRS